MDQHSPLITVLIVTWNRKNALIKCVESVLAQTYKNLEIIIIDNNSSDGTSALVKKLFPGVTIIRTTKNLGCPSGRNLGFANSNGNYIYCLDDDGWLHADAIKIAFNRANTNSKIAIVQSQINEVQDTQVKLRRPDYSKPMYVSTFSGGCFLIKKDVLDETGFFPDDFFRQAEEEDLALRILGKGYHCVFEPLSVMYHAPTPIGRSDFMIYKYTLCNNMKIGLRHWPLPWALFRVINIFYYALRYSIINKTVSMPPLILGSFIKTAFTIFQHRGPVSKESFQTYLKLKKAPRPVNLDKCD